MRKCGSGIFLLFSKLFKLKSNYKTTYTRNTEKIKVKLKLYSGRLRHTKRKTKVKYF